MIFRWDFIGKGRFCLYPWAQVYCLSDRATVGAGLPAMDAALQAQTLSRAWPHMGRRLRIHRIVTCVFTGRTNCVFTQVITCSFTGCHLRFYRARRLRSNTRPPASAAATPLLPRRPRGGLRAGLPRNLVKLSNFARNSLEDVSEFEIGSLIFRCF